jgi:hypothetical protein
VCALIHLNAVRDSVLIKNIVQLGGIDAYPVLVADIDRNAVILAQIADILLDKGERRVRCPFREDIRLRLAVFCRQIKISR